MKDRLIGQKSEAAGTNSAGVVLSKSLDRDRQGKFARGNSGGPGRPSRAIERDYIAAFRKAITPEIFGQIVGVLATKALAGDHASIELLAKYVVGSSRLDFDTLAAKEEAEQTSADDIELAATKIRIKERIEKIENLTVITNLLGLEKGMPDSSLKG